MTTTPDILLLTGPQHNNALTSSLPGDSMVIRHDPFAALEALADRPYRTVLVATPQPSLEKLLQAVRRLQPEARLFGLCTPAGEMEMRQACRGGERTVDDYFIIPPTPREQQRILGTGGDRAGAEGGTASREAGLSPRQLTELIESAVTPDELAQCVARLAGAVCQTELRWSRQGQPRAGVQQLLTLDDNPPRTLWSAEPLEPDTDREQWLSAMRGVLGGLAGNARRMAGLHRMAITDYLTGAYNRRYFYHFARQTLRTARERQTRATLLLYDIDDFKGYNDEFGYAAGDDILREAAQLMKQTTRKGDLVARIGGDEFAVLFSNFGPARHPGSKPIQTAFDLADRFRKAVHSHIFKMLGPKSTGTLTISGGLASFPWDGLTVGDLMASANVALRRAKASGKNNIFLVGETPGPPSQQPGPGPSS